MHRIQVLAILLGVSAAAARGAEFSGARAFNDTRQVTLIGPRPPGSPALAKARAYVLAQLQRTGCTLVPDKFVASIPGGTLAMENIICRFAGKSGKAVVFTGHYDTKVSNGENFVGANDGGSSTGLLIELARALARMPRVHDVYLVWFDGEEAIRQWSATDGLHGSRHLAEKWKAEGMLSRIVALVNVDMIGDKSLGVLSEHNSDSKIRGMIWKAASDLGYGKHFLNIPNWVEDDHIPFVKAGVPAVDLIDFDYGPDNAYWHTEADTIDKLAPESFDVIGKVLIEFLKRLETGR